MRVNEAIKVSVIKSVRLADIIIWCKVMFAKEASVSHIRPILSFQKIYPKNKPQIFSTYLFLYCDDNFLLAIWGLPILRKSDVQLKDAIFERYGLLRNAVVASGNIKAETMLRTRTA